MGGKKGGSRMTGKEREREKNERGKEGGGEEEKRGRNKGMGREIE